MPCTPNPDPDRPRADELLWDEKTDPRVSVHLIGNTTRLARWRDLTDVVSAELPVLNPKTDPPDPEAPDACVGMRAGDASLYPDVADDVALAEVNYRALQRVMALVSRRGGGKVLIPDRRDPALRSPTNPQGFVPFYWHGPIAIPEGVELVIDGLLKVPTGGLTGGTFPDANGDPVRVDHTSVTFEGGIAFAAISGRGVIDGNARACVEHPDFPHGWIGEANSPAKGACNGVYWGPRGGTPPTLVHIEGVTVRDTLRNCFVGSLSNVRIRNVSAGESLTDHLYYFSDGDNHRDARGRYTGLAASDLDGWGYWRAGALNLADGHVHGLTIRDVVENPTHTLTHPGIPGSGHYPRQPLNTVVGPRPYKVAGTISGLDVHVDFGLIGGVVSLRGRGFRVQGDVTHTGGPSSYLNAEDTVASPGEAREAVPPPDDPLSTVRIIPCTVVDVGRPYEHLWPTGCAADLRVHRAPGLTRLFGNASGPFYGVDLRFQLDYHPDTGEEAPLIQLWRTGYDLRAHVEAWERAAGGGGPERLIELRATNAALVPEPEDAFLLEAPTPAEGVHGVVVSGRVHTARTRDWCRFQQAAPVVSGLVARGLTVVAPASPNAGALTRWLHEEVAYRGAGAPPASATHTFVYPPPPPDHTPASAPKVEVHLPPGVTGAPPDRVRITALNAVRPQQVGPALPLSPAIYGVAMAYRIPDAYPPPPTGTRVAVHLDPSVGRPTETNPVGLPLQEDDEVTVTYEAERYERLRGDRHDVQTVTITAEALTTNPPTPERTYDFAHGLVVRPAYWEPAVWLRPDGTRVVLATELKGDGVHVRVTFPEGALQASDVGQTVALWFRATVGRPA